MRYLGQIDPGENAREIVDDLSNTDLPELMAMVLVFASIALMLYMVYKIVDRIYGGKKPTEQDTTRIMAEVFGDIIATKLESIMTDMKTDQQKNTQEHRVITEAMNTFGSTMERIAELITTHNNKAEEHRNTVGQVVGELTQNLGKTNKVVSVMKTDITQIKDDLAVVKTTVNNLETRGLPLDTASLALLKQFIQCAKDLETQLSKATQETPVTPKTRVEIEEDKPNVQSIKQSTGLDTAAGVDRGAGGSDDGNGDEAVHS